MKDDPIKYNQKRSAIVDTFQNDTRYEGGELVAVFKTPSDIEYAMTAEDLSKAQSVIDADGGNWNSGYREARQYQQEKAVAALGLQQ